MLNGYTISRHLLEERGDRVAAIGTTMGFGEIMYRFQSPNSRGERIEAVTSTGIIVVLSVNEKLIITMYPATLEKLYGLFKGERIPKELYNTVKRNIKLGFLEKCD